MKPVVWVADIGAVLNNHFGWCRNYGTSWRSGRDIREFAKGIGEDLSDRRAVALGFECPLFVPIAEAPECLTRARQGEGRHAWSAGPGASALTTGLVECVWVFEQIRKDATVAVSPTFDWQKFLDGRANLFIWEAFVTGGAKGNTDSDDAKIAARAFRKCHPAIDTANCVSAVQPFSLVAAGLLRARLSDDTQLLFDPCIVICAQAK
jgi:hypothetical protein